ncbi:response regulator [Thioalkalivibrio sp. XN8]|uniref:response regulator n=1 Tax=Thioalkalivibrio sp. XN8 TaxID=2712863 RepID=UPI0013EB72CB|nr:response regulator [Thioalkalivibrio sp. XN8]NGP52101.1 response regulator [Thioalkalivibrio sp. XN8]
MAQKRALVVDDSRAARVALQRMLERYDVQVDFAESGEDAIEFLRHQAVDVIFMDHSMPGMDGFEAVSAIKADARTALIPVMMYTAKEGEVYVGQARALGAVGVLPKDVKPGVLFEMLLKLGLVKDRRAALRRRTEEAETDGEDETDRALERQAMGASVQALITRTLQDQHLELRTDILASNRDFARRVAEEIWGRQKAEAELARQEAEAGSRGTNWGVVATLLVLVIVPIALLFLLFSQASQQRNEAVADNARLRQAIAAQAETIDSLTQDGPLGPRTAGAGDADAAYRVLVGALGWATSQDTRFGFGELPFDDRRLEQVTELLARLTAAGFDGSVRLDAHLGEFCMQVDETTGRYRLADPDTPLTACEVVGNPLAEATPAAAQSSAFQEFLAAAPMLSRGGIDLEVVLRGSRDSQRLRDFPPDVTTAGEWNAIAARNNRVEFSLFPRPR